MRPTPKYGQITPNQPLRVGCQGHVTKCAAQHTRMLRNLMPSTHSMLVFPDFSNFIDHYFDFFH